METKKTIENLLIECREMLANKIFPLAENELVESHVSSSFEFGYICGALRYRELTDGDNALEREIERYEEELHGFESSTRADCINIARHFAKWQKKQDNQKCQGCFDRDEVFFKGMQHAKGELKKEAIEVEVTETCGIPSLWIKMPNSKQGDKVDLLILKK